MQNSAGVLHIPTWAKDQFSGQEKYDQTLCLKGWNANLTPCLECLISLCENLCRKVLIRWNWNVLLKCLHFDENSPQATPPIETCLVCCYSASLCCDSKTCGSLCWKAWKCSLFIKIQSFMGFGFPANMRFVSCDELCCNLQASCAEWRDTRRMDCKIFLC